MSECGPLIAAGVLAAGQPSAKAPQAVSVAGIIAPATTCSACAEIQPMGTPSGVSAPGLAPGSDAVGSGTPAPARDGMTVSPSGVLLFRMNSDGYGLVTVDADPPEPLE